ncbi:MAG: hypothetical protein NXI24_16955 [bacterium]|nr:hypothetical protein [bacterium]
MRENASLFETETTVWKEIVDRKKEFQEMLRLLLHFDERSGRFREYSEPELHFMRKSAAVADAGGLRVYLRDLGARIYYVVLEVQLGGGRLSTAYVHEDGISLERANRCEEPEHPVHHVTCLTDLYTAGPATARVLPEDLYEIGPGAPGDMAIELMLDDSLFVD